MGQSRKWEVSSELTLETFDEVLPHESSCSILREWEVNGLLEELFEFFLRAFFGFRGATNDSDSQLISDELALPLKHGLLEILNSGCI